MQYSLRCNFFQIIILFPAKTYTFARPKNKARPDKRRVLSFTINDLVNKMAHHLSALKRIRQNTKRRLQNRYYKKTARTAIQKLREMKEVDDAKTFLPKVLSMIDRLAKKNTWHPNKAANLKSSLMRHVNGLGV